jgi:hypothetical protein
MLEYIYINKKVKKLVSLFYFVPLLSICSSLAYATEINFDEYNIIVDDSNGVFAAFSDINSEDIGLKSLKLSKSFNSDIKSSIDSVLSEPNTMALAPYFSYQSFLKKYPEKENQVNFFGTYSLCIYGAVRNQNNKQEKLGMNEDSSLRLKRIAIGDKNSTLNQEIIENWKPKLSAELVQLGSFRALSNVLTGELDAYLFLGIPGQSNHLTQFIHNNKGLVFVDNLVKFFDKYLEFSNDYLVGQNVELPKPISYWSSKKISTVCAQGGVVVNASAPIQGVDMIIKKSNLELNQIKNYWWNTLDQSPKGIMGFLSSKTDSIRKKIGNFNEK